MIWQPIDLSPCYEHAFAVLLILLALVNGKRGYWKGRAGALDESEGWADEARWWRREFEGHVSAMRCRQAAELPEPPKEETR